MDLAPGAGPSVEAAKSANAANPTAFAIPRRRTRQLMIETIALRLTNLGVRLAAQMIRAMAYGLAKRAAAAAGEARRISPFRAPTATRTARTVNARTVAVPS